jgi:ferredoxin
VKVFVDRDRCQGHLRCYALVPEVFEPDELGHAFTSEAGNEVPPDLESKVRQSVGNCPEQAIRLEQ